MPVEEVEVHKDVILVQADQVEVVQVVKLYQLQLHLQEQQELPIQVEEEVVEDQMEMEEQEDQELLL
jgi:hypothetical protein